MNLRSDGRDLGSAVPRRDSLFPGSSSQEQTLHSVRPRSFRNIPESLLLLALSKRHHQTHKICLTRKY